MYLAAMGSWGTSELPANCPPDGHVDPSGVYFRYTNASLGIGDSPSEDDWLLPVDKPGPHYKHFDDCDAYAISLFRDVRVLLRARGVMPFARKKTIAQLELSPGMGPVRETPSSVGPTHHDWWPAMEAPPQAVVVEGRAG